MGLFRRSGIGSGVRSADGRRPAAQAAPARQAVRETPPREAPREAPPKVRVANSLPAQYRRGRSAAALVALLALFVAMWGLNGHTTALGVMTLFGWSYAQGWLAHLVMTLIELSLPQIRPLLRGVPFYWGVVVILFLVVLAVGVFDVFSFTLWAYGFTGAAVTTQSATAAAIVGELFAIVPEPVIIALSVALWRLRQTAGG
jgi:hypothetical protein